MVKMSRDSWWNITRSVQVKSPFSNMTYTMYRYSVSSSAPRPESYLTGRCLNTPCISSTACLIVNLQIIDYLTVKDPSVHPPLNDSQKADLYAELGSASESGWDFSMRWYAGSPSTVKGLASLNVRNIVGPDLNAIMCEYLLQISKMMQDSN